MMGNHRSGYAFGPPVSTREEGGLRTRDLVKRSSREKPLISVITVVFNGERSLARAIDSVIGQTYDNIEYIVVDGGSKDNTVNILRQYQDHIDYWVSEPDDGIYDAMNKGVGLATGEIIGILNSDDWYVKEACALVAESYRSQPNERIVIAGRWNILIKGVDRVISVAPSLDFRIGMPMSHQGMFIPAAVYEEIGIYDVRYRYAADLDLAVRLHRGGVEFLFLENVLVNFRTDGAGGVRFRESGKEAASIIKRCLPRRTYLTYQLLRVKYELLMFSAIGAEKLFGAHTANRMKNLYFNFFYKAS